MIGHQKTAFWYRTRSVEFYIENTQRTPTGILQPSCAPHETRGVRSQENTGNETQSRPNNLTSQPNQPRSNAQWMLKDPIHWQAGELMNRSRTALGKACKSRSVRKSIVLN